MVADGSYTAVLDRFEATQADRELAVLLLDADGEGVDEIAVERDQLPDDGRHAGAVFEMTVVDGDLQSADYRPDETKERSEAAQSRFDRLARRPQDTDADSGG